MVKISKFGQTVWILDLKHWELTGEHKTFKADTLNFSGEYLRKTENRDKAKILQRGPVAIMKNIEHTIDLNDFKEYKGTNCVISIHGISVINKLLYNEMINLESEMINLKEQLEQKERENREVQNKIHQIKADYEKRISDLRIEMANRSQVTHPSKS
jgi:ribulose kinase